MPLIFSVSPAEAALTKLALNIADANNFLILIFIMGQLSTKFTCAFQGLSTAQLKDRKKTGPGAEKRKSDVSQP
jgi:hypothetical protein